MNISDIFKSHMQESFLEPSVDLWSPIEKRMDYSDEYLQQENIIEREEKQEQTQNIFIENA